MTKNEIVEKLRKAGYHVSNESGVVTFKVAADGKWPLDEIKKKLAALEYEGSFGFTCVSADKFKAYAEQEEETTAFVPDTADEETENADFDFDDSNTEFVQTSLFDM